MPIWPQDTIDEFLTTAMTNGTAMVELDTPEQALRFKWAVNNYRRRHGKGFELTISLSGHMVYAEIKQPIRKLVVR